MDEFTPSLERRVQDFLNRGNYRPLKQHELARALRLRGADRAQLRRTLRQMERSGKVVRLRKNRWALPDSGQVLVGVLRVHPQGFGFITPDESGRDDVYVPPEAMGTALHGDRVMASVIRLRPRKRKHVSGAEVQHRTEGTVLRVVERRTSRLAGLLRNTPYYAYVIPDNPRLHQHVRVNDPKPATVPKEDHKVVVRLDPWESHARQLTGSIDEDLGAADQPGVDMLALIRDHDLALDFPADAIDEAQSHPTTPDASAYRDRRDLRDLLTFTIDPEDAKDFDDAVSLRRRGDGHYELGVHIADVAHYVQTGTAVDREARVRGTSVYLADRVIPMLPSHLTTEVCSLRPGVDRLTHTVQLTIDASGEVLDVETFPSVIRSRARLNYDQVQATFDGRRSDAMPEELDAVLGEMRHLAGLLRQRRLREGSVDLAVPEVQCRLDEEGRVIGLKKRGATEAYGLIEDFMLAANQAVARLLEERGRPAVYRIHPPPSEEQWVQMAADLLALGIDDAPQSRTEINHLIHRTAQTPIAYGVSLAIVRNFMRASYAAERLEHFGLAFTHYTHFTSPIRRYPDLIVHRVLKSIESGAPSPYDRAGLDALAAHCSETERNAADAETESMELKRLEYYERLLWEGHIGPFSGVVVSILPKRGVMVELEESLQRGLVPFGAFQDDFYRASADRSRIVGRRFKREWRVGELVQVDLSRVDRARRQIDFHLVEQPKRRRRRRATG